MKKVRFVPTRSIKMMAGAHFLWLFLVFLLGGWWGRLLHRQAAEIAQLEERLGVSVDLARTDWYRTQRMLYWESASFFALLIATSALLFWLYWRDIRRAQSLQAFFASVTHELRTPLTSIRLQAESLSGDLGQDSSQKRFVQRLLEDTVRLEAQVDRTLELARVEGGGPVFSQTIPLKSWLERFLRGGLSGYEGRFDWILNVNDISIQADPSALQVIVKNLIENSVRHSGRERVQMRIRSSVDEGFVRVAFKDNSQHHPGDLAQLGHLFYRGALSQGTGVGLYLVRVLMKKMGGRVRFQFEDGFQTLLWFREGERHE